MRNIGDTTIGKVAHFFEKQGSLWTNTLAVWVAVMEYVFTGNDNSRKVDYVVGIMCSSRPDNFRFTLYRNSKAFA